MCCRLFENTPNETHYHILLSNKIKEYVNTKYRVRSITRDLFKKEHIENYFVHYKCSVYKIRMF